MPNFLLSGSWYTQVRRLCMTEIKVLTHYLDKDSELEGWFLVDPREFKITAAAIDVLRGPWETGSFQLTDLIGQTAYISSGKLFRRATAGDASGLWTGVMLEGIKGLLQAEVWLVKERGFASAEEYDSYFKRKFAGSCIHYSNPGEIKTSFFEHLADQKRQELLFARQKHSYLEQQAGRFYLTGELIDSFHQMVIKMEINPEGRILAEAGQVLRSPDVICKRGEKALANLLDLKGAAAPAAWQKAASGPQGCSHLGDLAFELARLWERFNN